jgi:nitric oxide reductase NorQ protein
VLKDLKPSTRQRMVGLELCYPAFEQEVEILIAEAAVPAELARDLVKLGNAIRKLDISSMPEVASTRTLVTAARLMGGGLAPGAAARAAIIVPLTDDAETARGLLELINAYLS